MLSQDLKFKDVFRFLNRQIHMLKFIGLGTSNEFLYHLCFCTQLLQIYLRYCQIMINSSFTTTKKQSALIFNALLTTNLNIINNTTIVKFGSFIADLILSPSW